MIPNRAEVFKLSRLSIAWLSIIFGIVWAVCWSIGVGLPMLLEGQFGERVTLINEILKAVTPIVAILVFIPINAMFMVLIERRALAIFTVRKGPNRVGPDGNLQTMADAVKLLLKEDIDRKSVV